MKWILPATVLLAVSQLASRALGVLRDHLFAQSFGATGGTGIWNIDTYYAAFRLPDLVYSLLIFGVLSAAFVPLLAEKEKDNSDGAFASNVLHVLLIAVGLLCGALYLIAEPVAGWLTPGFSAAEMSQTAELLRIQLLAPIFFTVSAVFGGLAQHLHRFTWYALAPIMYNLGIVGGAVFLAPEMGVYGLSWGVAIGAGLHAAIQLPGIWRGWQYKCIFRPSELVELFNLAGPRVAAMAANQFQFVIITVFATLIGTGALAVFNYAFNLASLPLGVVGVAFATVSFAGLARLADQPAAFAAKLGTNILGVLFWALPAAVGLFLLRFELVSLILAGGAFTDTDIDFVAASLGALAFGIPAMSIIPLLNNAFFARKQTGVPLAAGLIMLLTTWLGARWLMPTYETTGLAAAYAIAAILAANYLLYQLLKNHRLVLLRPLGKSLLAVLAMAVPIWLIGGLWQAGGFGGLLLETILLSALGGGIYLGVTKLLGLDARHLLQ